MTSKSLVRSCEDIDEAAVAADFHLGNGACYYEEQRIDNMK